MTGATNHSRLLERLLFFSDAVFAIAITLLVIELHVPHIPDGPLATHTALEALAERLPSFIGFIASFFVIGAFWASHHRAFGLVAQHDPSFIWPNLHLLLLIAFLPFSTAFMSQNINQILPNLFYLATLLLLGLMQVRLYRRVLRHPFVDETVPPGQIAGLWRRTWAVPLATLAAMAVAFVVPALCTVTLLLIPILTRLLERRGRTA